VSAHDHRPHLIDLPTHDKEPTMPAIASHNPASFNAAGRVNWFGPMSQHGQAADLRNDAYADDSGLAQITLKQAAPAQSLTVSVCAPTAGLRCNVEPRTGLLVAENRTNAPIRLSLRNGVGGIAAFVTAPAPFGSTFMPRIWVECNGSGSYVPFDGTIGATGDIWMRVGDSVAPFVGAVATGGDRITGVQFEAVRPGAPPFDPLAIGYLYCLP
jgi:hypothetical protein